MANRNARVIIPLAIGFWLAGIIVSQLPGDARAAAMAALVVAAAIVIPYAVFRLLAATGWDMLAKSYRSRFRYSGSWQTIPTAQMALCSVNDPEYQRNKARLVSTLKAGTSADGLHFSLLLSKVPILGLMFPEVHVPWAEVKRARTYEAPGWVTPSRQTGAILQATYDPNYTGQFVELEVGEPTVYIQLPAALFGEDLSRLPLTVAP